MHFIKEIIQGNPDQEHIHHKFVRYSRGEFPGPAITAKKTSGVIKINASDEYASLLGWLLVKNSSGRFSASGSIVSREDPSKTLEENKIPAGKAVKKKGVYTTAVKCSAEAADLAKAYENLAGAYVFLDLAKDGGKEKLKTKKKPPKPGSGADEQFCSATMGSSAADALMEEIFFDLETKDFSEAKVTHAYEIKDLLVPKECEKDYSKARVAAKRKGTLRRMVEVNGEKKETTYELLV